MSTHILVVDDEKELADVLELYLVSDGYTVHKCYTGAEAMDCMEHTDLDLAILDVMLPDADGFQLCKKLREKSYCPIIMLTARTADGDKIMGLTIGADDYITKPFNPLEFSVLWYLCEHQGVVVPSEELFEAVWGEKYLKNNNTVMAHIGRLREKLDEPARSPRFIKTVWGVGYTIEK